MPMRIMALVLLMTGAPIGVALADCEDGVAALTTATSQATDPHAREILARDLAQAQMELWEFDEVECAVALDHAARFLRRQTQAENAPAR